MPDVLCQMCLMVMLREYGVKLTYVIVCAGKYFCDVLIYKYK